ncbi:MAG: hypothetical protein WKG01_01005 [Kofleriaceae bacterium]
MTRALTALLLAMTLGTTNPIAAAPPVANAPASVDPALIDGLKLSRAGTAAVRRLLDPKIFGGWAVGAAAQPTDGVAALRTIMKERNAVAALGFLRMHATMEGQLMALVGLYDLDPVAFHAALPTYLNSKASVRVWETGCMMGPDRAVADLVRAKGAVQTGGPGMPLPRWQPKHPGQGIVFDLAGGGYSAVMRERTTTP